MEARLNPCISGCKHCPCSTITIVMMAQVASTQTSYSTVMLQVPQNVAMSRGSHTVCDTFNGRTFGGLLCVGESPHRGVP